MTGSFTRRREGTISTYPKSPERRALHALALEAIQQDTLPLALKFIHQALKSHAPSISSDDAELCSIVELITLHFQKLDTLTHYDHVTGLRNRRYFETQLKQTLYLAQRHKFSFSLALLDIDNFKTLNDQQGHAAGDQALKSIAQLLSHELRESDLIARYGGDEFAILAPYSEEADLQIIANRVQTAIAQAHQPLKTPLLSAGWTHISPINGENDALKIIEMADRALYEAKRQGGGLFCVSP